jgi:heavy metal sensor kinase
MFRTIGARLTLWGACITLAVCTFLSVALYVGLSISLRDGIDTFLEGEVHEFMVTVNSYPGDDAGLQHAIRVELGSRVHGDLAFRLFSEQGKLLVTSESNDPVAALWNAPDGWDRDSPHFVFQTVRLEDNSGSHRTCSLRVTTDDGRICTAQASYTLDRMDASLVVFRHVCAVGLGLAAALSMLSGYVLARRSLRPVQALTDTAERIGAKSLSERIPLTGSGDELDRLASTLNNMLERVEHHVRQVQQFTADASHELRSPLAALRGTAEVALSQSRSTSELRQVLEESIEHYDRLSNIAEDLLLLARADAGHEVVCKDVVRLDDAVASVVDLYAPLAVDRGFDLVMENVDREEISLQGDGARLRQLVGNLIDNAIKFSKAGGRINVSVTCADGKAKITIEDEGEGIAAEHLPHIFDRFYRADQARSMKYGGAGLGLPICRAIAEAHGGTIDVKSILGVGTVVTVVMTLDTKEE